MPDLFPSVEWPIVGRAGSGDRQQGGNEMVAQSQQGESLVTPVPVVRREGQEREPVSKLPPLSSQQE